MKSIQKTINYAKKVNKKLRDPFWQAKSNYIKYYDSLRVNEKLILLESEHGKKIDGNVFYILKYISQNEKYNEYKIYLSAIGRHLNKFRQFLDNHNMLNVNLVILASDEYMRLLASAKYLINDTSFGSYFIKKEGQIYLNTWHGTPLKTLGKSDKSNFYNLGNIQKNFVISDYLLYPNEYTMQRMMEDYMLENISSGEYILGGYPRNEIFFDESVSVSLREKLDLKNYKIYVYMPTYRGDFYNKEDIRGSVYLSYYLYELDKMLNDLEILYVNLHPLAQKTVNFKNFKHIQQFPSEYETYEFLNIADVLISDYSSVIFDFACTSRKIVLFTYDEEEYSQERGLYIKIEELPFPKVNNIRDLLNELRTPKKYSDEAFRELFCKYDNSHASQQLCDFVILQENTNLTVKKIPDNGKENVLIYAGNLSSNGITTSLRNLMNVIDLNERNYYVSFMQEKVGKKNSHNLKTFPENCNYYATTGDMNVTIIERVIRKLFKRKIIPAKIYMKLMKKRVMQDFYRNYGQMRLDNIIQYNGYEDEVILQMSMFNGKKTIFVHSDMLREIETRGNQRKDVLNYAYNQYDSVAVVTKGLLDPTNRLVKKEKAIVVENAIDYVNILKKSKEKIILDVDTKLSCTQEEFNKLMNCDIPKIINIGRFSPEKGHIRLVDAFYRRIQNEKNEGYLIIMGGNSLNNGYVDLLSHIKNLGIENRVILIEKVSNPYPILKACDYFILSSHYEGFGLALIEADILGKPVVSTDIVGPRSFMLEHGGRLVENSEEGIYQGIELLLSGQVKPLVIDYKAYNETVKKEFEELFK